jgi:2,4-dienoyl-CoA reductase-like NADH-dependent reductase (Old Yellow Enzyme family)
MRQLWVLRINAAARARGLKYSTLMDGLRMNYVNISAGIPGITTEMTRPTEPSKLFYLHQFRYAAHAKTLLSGLSNGVRVIGSAYSILRENAASAAEENIARGHTDFAGFGRQCFADPRYPKKLQEGEAVNYCTACSGCSKLMLQQLNDGCILYNAYYRDLYRSSLNKEKKEAG